MLWFKKGLLTMTLLYILYVVKWAVGIDIFAHYHAPRLVKLPAEVVVHELQTWGLPVTLPGMPLPVADHETLIS